MARIDLDLPWGGDLSLSPSGDLQTVREGSGRVQQKLLRILFSNGLLYHPAFGDGIGEWVGVSFGEAEVEELQSIIEDSLIADPDITDPVVKVSPVKSNLAQVMVSGIDVYTGNPIAFTFGVGGS